MNTRLQVLLGILLGLIIFAIGHTVGQSTVIDYAYEFRDIAQQAIEDYARCNEDFYRLLELLEECVEKSVI